MITKKRKDTRSPLKDKPLRNPGQSLDDEIQALMDDKVLVWIMAMMMSLMLAGLEWWRWYNPTPPSPVLLTIVAVVVWGIGVPKLIGTVRQLKRLALGRDGERAVGQYLEKLRQNGNQVFHDIVGDGFNVDHVVIGPTGIFTVETKTLRKPQAKDAKVKFDGTQLLVNGRPLDRDPVSQSQAQASWVKRVLQESTGKSFNVKSVVVFPGWYVESSSPRHSGGPWVLNPRMLPAFIEKESTCIRDEDVKLAAYHLSRHIRTTA